MSRLQLLRRGRVSLPPPDTTPEAFSFAPVLNADRSTAYESDEQALLGTDVESPFDVAGGTLIIGGVDAGESGTIAPGALFKVKLTSSASYGTLATATVTIGGISADFEVTTAAAPANESPAALPANMASLTVPPALSMQAATITTQAELNAVMASAGAGGVRYLGPGPFTINSSVFHTAQLILRPADPANPPVFRHPSSYLAVSIGAGGGNIWFDGVVCESDTDGYRTNPVVQLQGASKVRFSRCTITGAQMVNWSTYAVGASAAAGSWTNLGLDVLGCSEIIVDQNTFKQLGNGALFRHNAGIKTTDLIIVGNDFTALTEDGVKMAGVERVLFDWNYGFAFAPYTGMHNDFLQGQFNPANASNPAIRNDEDCDIGARDITITNNCASSRGTAFESGISQFLQGIFFNPVLRRDPTWDRIYINNNLLLGMGTWAVNFEDGNNVVIDNNLAYRTDDSDYVVAAVTFRAQQGDTVAIRNNVGQTFTAGTGADLSTNAVVSGNTVDAAEYSDAQFLAMETSWLAERDAAGF